MRKCFISYKKEDVHYKDFLIKRFGTDEFIDKSLDKTIDSEDGEYVIKRNFNKTLGTMKRYFLKMLMCEDEAERQKLQEKIWMNINGAICWVKKGERQFSRKQSVNKSSISYRKSY